MRESVLVVGGAGYIGAHCCKAIFDAGYLPVSFDNLSTGHKRSVKWGPLIEADIRDQAAVSDAIRQWRPEAVMHLAGVSLLEESVSQPELYYASNMAGTLSILAAMRETDCRALVFSSTAAVYGDTSDEPIPETLATAPLTPYGRSKLMAEQVIEDVCRTSDLYAFRFRYFNAAGADPTGEIGEDHNPETHLIPRAIMVALGDQPELHIFGDDYPTPDGTAIRDYVHVADLAKAHVGAVDLLANGHQGGCYNLGSGRGTSVKEVVAAVTKATGRPIPLVLGARRPGDPAQLVADVSRARHEIGFQAERSDIETIVGSAVIWHKLHVSGFSTKFKSGARKPNLTLKDSHEG